MIDGEYFWAWLNHLKLLAVKKKLAKQLVLVEVRKSEIITDYYPCNLWTTQITIWSNWHFATFY